MAVLHTTFVKATNPGGRLYTAVDKTEARKNGDLGFLGAIADGYGAEVKNFAKRNTNTHPDHQMPMIVMQPEMMYDNSRMSLNKLSNMEIPTGELFTLVPLEEGDKFDISADGLFKNNGNQADGTDLEVGKCYVLEANTTQLRLTAAGGGGGLPQPSKRVYFKIVNIKDAYSRTARINGVNKNNYKLYTMEVLRKLT